MILPELAGKMIERVDFDDDSLVLLFTDGTKLNFGIATYLVDLARYDKSMNRRYALDWEPRNAKT